MESMGFAWDFHGIFCVRFSVLAASGDEGVDDLPSAFSRIFPNRIRVLHRSSTD